MITLFNRKELIITMDMHYQAEIRIILEKNKIDFVMKTTNLENAAVFGSKRGRIGSFGIDPKYGYEFRIFVRKKDYARAKALIG